MHSSGPLRTTPEQMKELQKTYRSDEVWQFRNDHTRGQWIDHRVGTEPGWFWDTEYRKKP